MWIGLEYARIEADALQMADKSLAEIAFPQAHMLVGKVVEGMLDLADGVQHVH
ncbi:hypothetical protein D3C86_2264030 [compost metagenome]